MQYLHTMVRARDLEETLDFYCDKLGLVEVNRYDSEGGRFTLVFLCAPGDEAQAREGKSPLLNKPHSSPRATRVSDALRASGGGDFAVRLAGIDEIAIRHDSVMLEAGCTSFQVHMQVDTDHFTQSTNPARPGSESGNRAPR